MEKTKEKIDKFEQEKPYMYTHQQIVEHCVGIMREAVAEMEEALKNAGSVAGEPKQGA